MLYRLLFNGPSSVISISRLSRKPEVGSLLGVHNGNRYKIWSVQTSTLNAPYQNTARYYSGFPAQSVKLSTIYLILYQNIVLYEGITRFLLVLPAFGGIARPPG